jgi:hypothetical protein
MTSNTTQKDALPVSIRIMFAPGTTPLEPGKRKYFGVENVNTKEKTCIVNSIPQEVTNAIIAQLKKNGTGPGRRFDADTRVVLTQFTIETDKFSNMWYYRNSGSKRILIWAVYADQESDNANDVNYSFEYYKANPQINPWMVNNHRQREIFAMENSSRNVANVLSSNGESLMDHARNAFENLSDN